LSSEYRPKAKPIEVLGIFEQEIKKTMTKIKMLFTGLLFLTFVNTTLGQTNKFEIGIDGSPTLTFLRGNDFIENNHKSAIGFSGGLFFQFNFKKIISLRTNIAFERKGSAFTSQATDFNGNPLGKITSNTNFDYLTFPILVRATFGKKIQYFVNAGPYFGYLIKQTYVSEDENNTRTVGFPQVRPVGFRVNG
jgi:hypothetical protein